MTTLSADLVAGATTASFTDVTKLFKYVMQLLLIDDEYIAYDPITGVLNRGQNGTTDALHSAGANVDLQVNEALLVNAINSLEDVQSGVLLQAAVADFGNNPQGVTLQWRTDAKALFVWATTIYKELAFKSDVGLKAKVITGTRGMTAATGSVSYTGAGFPPKAIIALAIIDNTVSLCIGLSDSNRTASCILCSGTSANWDYNNGALLYIATLFGATLQLASVSSYNTDGFTLSWTKIGSPTGTAQLIFLCLG
jgi:hypothetical protein